MHGLTGIEWVTASWQKLWRKIQHTLKLLIRAVYDQLPTTLNVATRRLKEDPSCALCGKTGLLRHILSGCPISLAQGRYKWCHKMVLRELAGAAIDQARRKTGNKQGLAFTVCAGRPRSLKHGRTKPVDC